MSLCWELVDDGRLDEAACWRRSTAHQSGSAKMLCGS
jgi:hypothetical protein